MKKRFVRLSFSLLLVIIILCSFSITAFADAEHIGMHNWKNGDVPYSATVARTEAYSERDIPIMSSAVEITKNTTHVFGGCTYNVNYTSTLWTSYVSYLNTAGAKVNVKPTYNKNIQFVNTCTFTATHYSGTYCAMTTCYGYYGSYYVIKHTQSPQTLSSGDFSFAPFNCDNMILYVLDTRYI